MPNTILIVPGLHGSGEGHWQSWWLKDDRDAVLVEQADWSDPDADRWLAELERAVITHPHAVIVAHSLGTILVARLARSRVAPLVAGALLVAPADIERTGAIHDRTYEFGSIPTQRLPFPSILATSRNDPYMPFDRARELGGLWGSRVRDLGHAGHININSGFGRWPDAYAWADSLIDIDISAERAGAFRVSQ